MEVPPRQDHLTSAATPRHKLGGVGLEGAAHRFAEVHAGGGAGRRGLTAADGKLPSGTRLPAHLNMVQRGLSGLKLAGDTWLSWMSHTE